MSAKITTQKTGQNQKQHLTEHKFVDKQKGWMTITKDFNNTVHLSPLENKLLRR